MTCKLAIPVCNMHHIWWCLCFILAGCQHKPELFHQISADQSGITFNNRIVENDSINPIDLDFLYNGGGVAAGDFNNDGLPDLYFTASTVSNKLYLNKGKLTFRDITDISQAGGAGSWCNAASVVDINNDGWQDIYVCTTIKKDPNQRKNLLYINQGLNKDGIPVFREMAAAYGLADTSYSVHAAFFDYDNDGDLDMYLVTTKIASRATASFSSNKSDNDSTDIDKLYRNDWNDSLKHPVFINVSRQAGIVEHGFGLGISIADINRDGWKDIYVTNDFYGSDLLYINNKDGSFSNKTKAYFRHTSQNAMGNDIADINNDGLADILAVDMNPEDNYRKKKNMNGNNYFVYQNQLYENLVLQYVRNTLQLNAGPVQDAGDSMSHPVFSDISFYTGTAETDWSWSALMADVNNDGFRDILVTNGYPKDVTDHDFAAFRNTEKHISKEKLIEQIPAIKIPNYGFVNHGNLQFENATEAWGMTTASFSNGAVCIDLDNDGDLDYVINNINDEAFLYENTSRKPGNKDANYLVVQFRGSNTNPYGIGAWAEIYYDHGKQQVYENSPYRGYLSTGDNKAFFGLANVEKIDSLVIIWPGDKKQVLQNFPVNQAVVVDSKNAAESYYWNSGQLMGKTIFTDITRQTGINYSHQETDVIDFDKERLIPHKLSEYGPALAAADIDGNGLDDIVIGGSGDYPGKIFLQQPGGQFIARPMPEATGMDARRPENMGLLFFDADGDGDLDLYCASGSNEFAANTKNYQDQLFVNDGNGNFLFDTSGALPANYTSKSCVKAADIDDDGDLDLFVGGRCLPGKYPLPVSSFVYRNDSKNGKIVFTDITPAQAGGLQNIGMVCDALWTDFDNDGLIDLVVSGEWMPVTFFKNNHGRFENITAQTGIGNEYGWWNSLVAGDFDNDGDMDYIAGNLGQNSFFRASNTDPVNLYAKDFDGNGSTDPVITMFLPDGHGAKKEYTAFNRDDIMNQLPGLKRKLLTYKDFASATIQQLFTDEQMKGALKLHANNFSSCYIRNLGNGKFSMEPLPAEAQFSPLYGMIAGDVNHDGNLDLLLTGNDFGNEVTDGRYDAFNGLVLIGNGEGGFKPLPVAASGIYIPGNGKALVKLKTAGNDYLVAAAENKGPLRIFRHRQPGKKIIQLHNDDKAAYITLQNDKIRKEELYYGTSFLSQSARFIVVDSRMKNMVIEGKNKQQRNIGL